MNQENSAAFVNHNESLGLILLRVFEFLFLTASYFQTVYPTRKPTQKPTKKPTKSPSQKPTTKPTGEIHTQ